MKKLLAAPSGSTALGIIVETGKVMFTLKGQGR